MSARQPSGFPGRAGDVVAGRVSEKELREAALEHELEKVAGAAQRRSWWRRLFAQRKLSNR